MQNRTKVLQIRMTEEELSKVKLSSGKGKPSAWAREILLEALKNISKP